MRQALALLLPLLLMLLTTCHKDGGRGGEGLRTRDGQQIHLPSLPYEIGSLEWYPPPDSIPSVADPRFVIYDEPQDTLFWMVDALRGGHLIGVAEGHPDEMLGMVRDVAVSDSLVYYLDGSYSHVRAYDFEGHLADIMGGPGAGPGEFGLARKVSVMGTGNNVHVVVGSGQHTVSVFSKSLDGSHVFQTSFRASVEFLNGEMCAMQGHVYTTGYSEDHEGVIHRHTLDGEYVSSFGVGSNHSHHMVRELMAEGGSLECNETHRVLLYTQPSAPIATAFTESGDMIWQIRFGDARIAPKLFLYTKKGDLVGTANWPIPVVGESNDIDVTGGARGDSFWLARLELLTKARDRWAHHFYKVDVLSGRGEYLGMHPVNADIVGRRVRAIDQEYLYTTQSDPYPQLGIHPIPDTTR